VKASRAFQGIVPPPPKLVDRSLAIAASRASQTGVLDSIAPERLLRALLLQVLYSVCSMQLLMEQLDYKLLFCGVVGLNMDDPICDPPVFTKHCERLLAGKVAQAFFDQVLGQAREQGLLSDEHLNTSPLMGP
jgi:transposase